VARALVATSEPTAVRLSMCSCNPATLARGLRGPGSRRGMERWQAAGVVNMFPHTSHVESIAMLEPTPADSAPQADRAAKSLRVASRRVE